MGSVRGQTPDDDAHRTVVTPAPSSQDWTPAATVIPRARLQQTGADAARVLDEEAGLRVTRLGGLGAFSSLSIRGSTADQVRLFLDGIPLSSAEGGPVDLATLPLGPLSSIHIHRGSSPIVYGGSAIGGVVDVRTRSLTSQSLELHAGVGALLSRVVRGFYGSGGEKASAGVSLDYAGSRGNFQYQSDNGTAFDTSDDRALERTNNDFDQFTALFKTQLRPSPGVRLTLLDMFTWSQRGLPGVGLYQTTRSHLTRSRNLLGASLEVAKRSFQLGASGFVAWSRTRLDDPLDEIGLGAETSVRDSWVPGIRLACRFPVPVEAHGGWQAVGVAALSYHLDRYEPQQQGARLRHRISAGAEVTVKASQVNTDLLASVRYEGSIGSLEDVSPSNGANELGEHHDASWRAAIVNRSIPDTRWSLGVARNVRLPSLYELYGDNGYVLGDPNLQPEEGLAVELTGTHFATWVGDETMLAIDLAGHVTWTENLIQFVQNAQGITRPENVDRALLGGIEAGVSADILGHLRTRTSLTWLHSLNQSDIAARRGKQLPFRPRWTFYSRVEGYYDFARAAIGEVAVWLDVDVTAGNVLDHANLVQVPERVLLGIGFRMELWKRQFRFGLHGRNLTAATVQDLAGFPLPGPSWFASVTWRPSLDDE